MEKDTQKQKEKMNKINLDGKAASTVPMDFNVAMATYVEDCVEAQEEKEFHFAIAAQRRGPCGSK